MKKLLILLSILPSFCFAAKLCPQPWELVPSPNGRVDTCRMAVPHGWLFFIAGGTSAKVRFISDEGHEWILGSK